MERETVMTKKSDTKKSDTKKKSKTVLGEKSKKNRSKLTSATDIPIGKAKASKIISNGNLEEISLNFDEIMKFPLSKISEISGKSVNSICESLSMVNPVDMIFPPEKLSYGKIMMIINVLYDVSGSMWSKPGINTYRIFHNKMGSIFKHLESLGVKIMIYYFSNINISERQPLTVDEFCSNSYIPGGGTYLSPAWNQLKNVAGTVLLVTDGQFSDSIANFEELKDISNLYLAVPSWTTISDLIVQQLSNKIGTIPLKSQYNCDIPNPSNDMIETLLKCCIVIDTPVGFIRYGNSIFPSCWTMPSVIARILSNTIAKHSLVVPIIFHQMNEIFDNILCSMRIDFEGSLKSDDARNFLTIISVFKKISLSEMNKLESKYGEVNMNLWDTIEQDNFKCFNEMLNTSTAIFNEGSNLKNILCKKYIREGLTSRATEITQMWDNCLSTDESESILENNVNNTQTHTLTFKSPMLFEDSRKIRASAHALEREIQIRLLMYFSRDNLKTHKGVHVGDGCIPVFNNNLIDTLRLIPSHQFFSNPDGISFSFSTTVAHHILTHITANMIGHNENMFQ